MVELARLRPEWSVVLVGPRGAGDPGGDVSALEAAPNIHLSAPALTTLPQVLRGADAGLIPYAINDLTRSVFPMKVYEYLAAGLPVVSTPLPALEGVEAIDTVADAAGLAAARARARRRHPRAPAGRSRGPRPLLGGPDRGDRGGPAA